MSKKDVQSQIEERHDELNDDQLEDVAGGCFAVPEPKPAPIGPIKDPIYTLPYEPTLPVVDPADKLKGAG